MTCLTITLTLQARSTLRCIGTNLHLKNVHGNGYQIELSLGESMATLPAVFRLLFPILYTLLSSLLIYSYPPTHPSLLSLSWCNTL
jgi:hypothetical protein